MYQRSFDIKKCPLIFGTHRVTGFAEGTSIKYSTDGDDWNKSTGSGGETTRVRNYAGESGSVEITLTQGSASNDFFAAQRAFDLASGGLGALPLMMKDLRGTKTLAVPWAYIRKQPDFGLGSEANNITWVIDFGAHLAVVGGNALGIAPGQ